MKEIEVSKPQDVILNSLKPLNLFLAGAGCFSGDTLVNTSVGYKKIGDVLIGDMVVSFNLSNKLPEFKKVINKFCYKRDAITQNIIIFTFKNKITIKCTENHEFYQSGKWVRAIDIARRVVATRSKRYSKGFGLQTKQVLVAREIDESLISGIDIIKPDCDVYDLCVEDNHNYCITRENIIVHNSGKTTCVGLIFADFIINFPKAIGLIGANTHGQLTKSTLKNVFETWLNLFNWRNGIEYVVDKIPPKHFKTFGAPLKDYDHTITFNNGAMLFTASLENYKAIDGTEIAYAAIDETKDTREEAPKDVIVWRLRQKAMWIKGGKIYDYAIDGGTGYNPLYVFTSPAKVDWINEWFGLTDKYEEISRKIFSKTDFFTYQDESRCVVISSTYHNEHNLPAGFIDEKLRQFIGNQNKIDMLIYGSPIAKTGGEFFNQFLYSKHVGEVNFREDLTIHFSLDFNVAPYITGLLYQIERKDNIYYVYQFDELCLESPKNNTEDLCKEFLNKYIYPLERQKKKIPGIFFYGDASGKNRSTLGKEHNFDILERVLKKYLNTNSDRVVKRNPSVVATRDFMNKVFAEGLPIRTLISSKCKNTIADMEFLKEAPDGGKLKKLVKDKNTGSTYEKYGHCSDSSIYFHVSAFESHFESE